MRMHTIRVGFGAFAVASFIAGAGTRIVAEAKSGAPSGPAPKRQVRFARVDFSKTLPEDLRAPEGKTRWDWTGTALKESFVRSLLESDAGLAVLDNAEGPSAAALTGAPEHRALYKDDAPSAPSPQADRLGRWFFPDRFPSLLKPGARQAIDLLEESDGRTRRLHADLETIGLGWLDLPSGPREVVLQRVLLLEEGPGQAGFAPFRLIHRFIDPRAGIVAEISRRPVPGDARSGRGAILEAIVLEQVLAGAATLKVYVDELDTPIFSGITYGWDKGAGTPISSLTPQGYATMGALIAADLWDFSQNTSGAGEDASTGVPVTPAETCNAAQCGYNPGGAFPNRAMSREDVTATAGGALTKTNAVTEREARPSDVTVWLRGGAQNEGVSGSLGTGESRFCYANDDGVTRSPVPLWRFPNQDPAGWFMQPGDPAFIGGPFNCEQNLFNTVCGSGGILPRIWSKGCTGSSGTHAGTQSGQVVKGGVVKLPSGHTFNALLVRTLADFCVYGASGCSSLFKVDEVRTFVYLWQVPVIGTVVRLTSDQIVADGTSFTSVAGTDLTFGLFPPLSLTVTGSTDSSVSLSWNPGLDTHRISGYKVYWGPSSGAGAPYPFDSVHNPGQVAFAGTSATISGLQSGTTYYFTVTSRSAYTDPSTNVSTTYESLLYPTQVSGDPSFVYPVEVQASTTGGTCIPTAEVTGLTVAHAPGGIQICWQPVSDPCLRGYEILGANSPTAAANFSVVTDTDVETCWTGNPGSSYFLVVARGTGGNGPWGAYGR